MIQYRRRGEFVRFWSKCSPVRLLAVKGMVLLHFHKQVAGGGRSIGEVIVHGEDFEDLAKTMIASNPVMALRAFEAARLVHRAAEEKRTALPKDVVEAFDQLMREDV